MPSLQDSAVLPSRVDAFGFRVIILSKVLQAEFNRFSPFWKEGFICQNGRFPPPLPSPFQGSGENSAGVCVPAPLNTEKTPLPRGFSSPVPAQQTNLFLLRWFLATRVNALCPLWGRIS